MPRRSKRLTKEAPKAVKTTFKIKERQIRKNSALESKITQDKQDVRKNKIKVAKTVEFDDESEEDEERDLILSAFRKSLTRLRQENKKKFEDAFGKGAAGEPLDVDRIDGMVQDQNLSPNTDINLNHSEVKHISPEQKKDLNLLHNIPSEKDPIEKGATKGSIIMRNCNVTNLENEPIPSEKFDNKCEREKQPFNRPSDDCKMNVDKKVFDSNIPSIEEVVQDEVNLNRESVIEGKSDMVDLTSSHDKAINTTWNTNIIISGGNLDSLVRREISLRSLYSALQGIDLTDEAVDLLINICSHVPLQFNVPLLGKKSKLRVQAKQCLLCDPYEFQWIVKASPDDIGPICSLLNDETDFFIDALSFDIRSTRDVSSGLLMYITFLEKLCKNHNEQRENKWYNRDQFIIPIVGNDHWSCALILNVVKFKESILKLCAYSGSKSTNNATELGEELRIIWLDSLRENEYHPIRHRNNLSCMIYQYIKLVYGSDCKSWISIEEFNKFVKHETIDSIKQLERDCGIYCAYNVNICLLISHKLSILKDTNEMQKAYQIATKQTLKISTYINTIRQTTNYIVETLNSRVQCGYGLDLLFFEIQIPQLSLLLNNEEMGKQQLIKKFDKTFNDIVDIMEKDINDRGGKSGNISGFQVKKANIHKLLLGYTFSIPAPYRLKFQKIANDMIEKRLGNNSNVTPDNIHITANQLESILRNARNTALNLNEERIKRLKQSLIKTKNDNPTIFSEKLCKYWIGELHRTDVRLQAIRTVQALTGINL